MAGLMDGLAAFGKGLAYNSDEAKQGRQDQRELDNYEKKLLLAQKLQEQMDERKRELAKSFPEVAKTYNTQWGVTMGVMTDGSVKELSRDQEVFDAYLGNKNAPAVRAATDAGLAPHRAGLMDAQGAAATTRAGAVAARVPHQNAKDDTPKAKAAPTLSQKLDEDKKIEKAAIDTMPGTDPNRKERAWLKLAPEEKEAVKQQIRDKYGAAAPTTNAPAYDPNDPYGDIIKGN